MESRVETRYRSPRLLRVFAFVLLLPVCAAAQTLADRALTASRAGQTEEALGLYRLALAAEPENVAILRDYAVVLGNAGRHKDALPIVQKVLALDANPPDWALREFAAIYLFGDSTAESLRVLDELARRGDVSEQTLNRRALALRWLGRSAEAQAAYRMLLTHHPASEEGIAGQAYVLAGEAKYPQALAGLTSSAPTIVKARIRILNWAGRHREARQLLDTLPEDLRDDREVLEDRVAAARWGGDPSGAVFYAERLADLYPGEDSQRLATAISAQYGTTLTPSFRFAKDSFGLTEKAWSGGVNIHFTPAHAVRAAYQYRWFEENGGGLRTLVRYELGWSGGLTPRLSAYASAATVDYREPGLKKKFVGDGSIAFVVNDALTLGAGGGTLVMDAYPALHNQVTGRFVFSEVAARPGYRTQVSGRASRYAFSDNVVRKRADVQVLRAVASRPAGKVSVGWRFSGMWHDVSTPDFWSPLRFQSNLAVAQAEGSLTPWLDYFGEIAAGLQSERGSLMQHPLQAVGRLALRRGSWSGVIESGKSTSSVDRSLPGQRPYSRWILSAGMEFRLSP
jgi:tetratricopeptide (TPR) repeat protein